MARPIRETPILLGEDARPFEQRMKKPRIVSKEQREPVKRNKEILLKAATNFR